MSSKESVRGGRAVFFVCFGVFCFALGYIDLGNRLFQTAGVTNVLLSCWNVGKIEALRWRRGGWPHVENTSCLSSPINITPLQIQIQLNFHFVKCNIRVKVQVNNEICNINCFATLY